MRTTAARPEVVQGYSRSGAGVASPAEFGRTTLSKAAAQGRAYAAALQLRPNPHSEPISTQR